MIAKLGDFKFNSVDEYFNLVRAQNEEISIIIDGKEELKTNILSTIQKENILKILKFIDIFGNNRQYNHVDENNISKLYNILSNMDICIQKLMPLSSYVSVETYLAILYLLNNFDFNICINSVKGTMGKFEYPLSENFVKAVLLEGNMYRINRLADRIGRNENIKQFFNTNNLKFMWLIIDKKLNNKEICKFILNKIQLPLDMKNYLIAINEQISPNEIDNIINTLDSKSIKHRQIARGLVSQDAINDKQILKLFDIFYNDRLFFLNSVKTPKIILLKIANSITFLPKKGLEIFEIQLLLNKPFADDEVVKTLLESESIKNLIKTGTESEKKNFQKIGSFLKDKKFTNKSLDLFKNIESKMFSEK